LSKSKTLLQIFGYIVLEVCVRLSIQIPFLAFDYFILFLTFIYLPSWQTVAFVAAVACPIKTTSKIKRDSIVYNSKQALKGPSPEIGLAYGDMFEKI
jgi:hypothetical protein